MAKKKNKTSPNAIAVNKKAGFEYLFLEEFEAGISLLGWEVKSLRLGKISFEESYILIKNGEAFLQGMHITPMNSASTHVDTNPRRTRKLLLNRSEINRLIGATEQKGLTIVPKKLYWKSGKVKVSIALAKGKKLHDKRHAAKQKDWDLDKQRLLKSNRL